MSVISRREYLAKMHQRYRGAKPRAGKGAVIDALSLERVPAKTLEIDLFEHNAGSSLGHFAYSLSVVDVVGGGALAHRIELIPTPDQETYFRKACAMARFTHSWALGPWHDLHGSGERPKALSLKMERNSIKGERFPGCTRGQSAHLRRHLPTLAVHLPTGPRSAPENSQTRRTTDVQDKGEMSRLRLHFERPVRDRGEPHAVAAHRLRGDARGSSLHRQDLGTAVSREADRWFVVVQVEVEEKPCLRENHAPVEIVLGALHAATLPTGKHYHAPRALRRISSGYVGCRTVSPASRRAAATGGRRRCRSLSCTGGSQTSATTFCAS